MKNHIQAPVQNRCVIITGGCGFLGSHLAEHYLKAGCRVVVVDNLSTCRPENPAYLKRIAPVGRLQIIRADCAKKWTWARKIKASWLKDLELVLHFASPASPPVYQRLSLETMWVNAMGTSEGMQLADIHGARLVFASTSEIYGDPSVSPQPETYWGNVNSVGPRSCYDEAKRFGESLIHTHNLRHGTKHGFVRIFNTYGPRMNPEDGRVVINFLVQAMRGEALTLFGNGRQTRSFCYVDDLVDGITRYAARRNLTDPVNLGNPVEVSMAALAQIVCAMHPRKKLAIRRLPLPQDDPRRRRPDIRRAKTQLGWAPKISLKEGLKRLCAWLQESV